jgi:hypothetical protein
VRGAHPLGAGHRGLTLRAATATASAHGAAEDVPQLPEQHHWQLHRDHERDEPRERSSDMPWQAAGPAGDAGRVERQRARGGKEDRPPDRDEHDRHQGVAPHPR